MGNQESNSVSSTSILNDIVTDIVISARQECASRSANLQNISISDIKTDGCPIKITDINQTMNVKSELDCTAKQDLVADLTNKLTEKLSQKAEAETSGLSGALSSSANSVNLANSITKVKNNVDVELLSSCLMENLNSQKISLSGLRCRNSKEGITISNISQSIIGTAVGKCFSEQGAVTQAETELDRSFEQIASAKNTGIKIASACGGSSLSLILLAVSIGIGYIMQQQGEGDMGGMGDMEGLSSMGY